MAAKGRIFASSLLVCAILLPSLASSFLDHHHHHHHQHPEFLGHDSRKTDVMINGDNNNVVRANDYDFAIPSSDDEKRKERSLKEKKSNKKKHNNKKKKDEKKSHEGEFGKFSHFFPGFNVPETPEEHAHPENNGGLQEGFYQETCPEAENIIKNGLIRAVKNDSTIAAAIPRLFLHDCFVNGCDSSILLDKTPSGEEVEKASGVNGVTVRGFELIDEVKAELEETCPGIVSCSDILAYLSRDAFVASGLSHYEVPGGRRDGTESLEANVNGNLPLPGDTVDQMIDLFKRKGLNAQDLVVLVGAHSIGVVHCFNFLYRLDDPEKTKQMDPRLSGIMKFICSNEMTTVPFDTQTQYKMDSGFYKQLLVNRGLLESDQVLTHDIRTRGYVQKLSNDEMSWFNEFGKAMNKLGAIEVLTGHQGQIRKQCRAVNL